MNEQRFVVSDALWQRLEPDLPFKVSGAGVTARTIAYSWMQSSVRCEPGNRGAIYRLPLVTRRVNSGDEPSPAHSRVFLNAMNRDPDLEYALIDGIIVQDHLSAIALAGD